MSYETLVYQQEDHVVTLTYNRPDQHNAINRAMNLEERLRIEAEMIISMFMRRDKHTLGAGAFKAGNLKPDWSHHGL